MTKHNLFKQANADLRKRAKFLATVPPSHFDHPVILYQSNYYRFLNDKCYIGTHTLEPTKRPVHSPLTWFNYDISIEMMINLEEKGEIIIRKRFN